MRSRSPKPASLATTSTGQSALFQKEFSKLLDYLGGRAPGLIAKHAGKLPWTEAGYRGQSFVRQRLVQMLPGKCERFLHPVGSGGDVQQSRMLRLPTSSTIEKYEASGYRAREILPQVALNHFQREVDTRGHPSRCPNLSISEKYSVYLHFRVREAPLQIGRKRPMGRCTAIPQQSCLAEGEGADANGNQPPGRLTRAAEIGDQRRGRRTWLQR